MYSIAIIYNSFSPIKKANAKGLDLRSYDVKVVE
jgi:hypothetical protein